MLLVEEKEIPIRIELVPMRSYGDKPREFMQKVPGGLLPAIEVNGQIITESQVIMELLDEWHSEGYKPMMPTDAGGKERYNRLARLEREYVNANFMGFVALTVLAINRLFSWWCTLLFRPEAGFGTNAVKRLLGGSAAGEVSASMEGFLDCMRKVDSQLLATKGPWFFAEQDHPTMIDFIYVSHVERMLASCAYWKGLDLRDPKWNLKGLNRWLEAFEKREAYLAFKSDYYTHVKDIPPQYGPGYTGGFTTEQMKFSRLISGDDGNWKLPLPHDDPLQPLYNGPPLPLCVLEAAGLAPDADGSYVKCDENIMSMASKQMAAWKLAGNGDKVARFAARGGPSGAKNMRKTFGAELADPYAEPDENIQPIVDEALRHICLALLSDSVPDKEMSEKLKQAVPSRDTKAVISCLLYLRNRVGVPRDLPLASARYLRAYLGWAMETLSRA